MSEDKLEQNTSEIKDKYVFPNIMAKIMAKVDTRTQMESSMMSLLFILFGILIGAIYMLFFTGMSIFAKFMVVFNGIAAFIFLSSFLVTSFQQYQSFMITKQLFGSDTILKLQEDFKDGFNTEKK